MWLILPRNNPSRFLTDYRSLNTHSPKIERAFPYIDTISNITTGYGTYYVVIDLHDTFFAFPANEERANPWLHSHGKVNNIHLLGYHKDILTPQ